MKRMLAMILAALLLLAPTFALAETEAEEPVVAYEFTDDYVLTDDGIVISIKDNPTTGYAWECARYDETMLELVADEFVPAETDLMGAPGVHQFTFKFIGTDGDARIRFAQVHAGDEAVNAALYYIIEASMGTIREVTVHEVNKDDYIELMGEETGDVRLSIPSSMYTHREDIDGSIYLISDDESTRFEIRYDPSADPEALLAEYSDKAKNAAQYDLEDRTQYVMDAERLTDDDGVPYAALSINTPEGLRLAEVYQAPKGGVLFVTMDYYVDFDD